MKDAIITVRHCGQYLQRMILPIFLAGLGVDAATGADALPLDKLVMPAGFHIEVYAKVENPRQMAQGDDGVVYVGSMRPGKVHAVRDTNGDHKGDQVTVIADELELPSGIAYRNGDLYVGAVSKILVYRNIQKQFGADLFTSEVLLDSLPAERHHGWKYLEFGPDGYLYIPVGAPCNICLSDDAAFAAIHRLNVDAKPATLTPFVKGVRNTVGFDFHPTTGDLWFADNGRDMLGDDTPPCELNHVTAAGQHFGYPFFHGHSIADPEFGTDKNPADYVEPALALGPHVAPLGMMFYTGTQFPQAYQQQILIPEHGSWNRSPEAGHTGHRITSARTDADGKLHYEVLIEGWLQDNVAWGRPADLLQLKDGSLLISDDLANVIYRLTYIAN
jgi:glucose/arabinose dehydrogenase